MNGPFDNGIDAQELALFLAISSESEEMVTEEREHLLNEQDQDEQDDLAEDEDNLPGL